VGMGWGWRQFHRHGVPMDGLVSSYPGIIINIHINIVQP